MYYETIKDFEKEILKYVNEIFKVYGNELQLRLEDYNLLENDNNCLQKSTAFGYIIEEFLVSKLEIYTKNHNNYDNYKISRNSVSTTNSSYDCFAFIKNKILSMVNIKADKGGNNAVSAINILYDDYVVKNPKIEKSFLILKVNYEIKKSEKDFQRKIFIKNITSYFLEEVDLGISHHQDNRNWSNVFNANSGRLQISNKFKKDNIVKQENISYENTCKMLENVIKRNKS